MHRALITGITGQDGAYLADYLVSKGYEVHGLRRRASIFNTERIDHLYQDEHEPTAKLFLHYGDMTDATSLLRILQRVQPDEIYNLAAQSHVAVSFETAEYTANVDALGALRILEAMRILGLQKTTKFYQASTSELYGLVQEIPQRETTPFYPRNPYAVAKLYAYWITVNYREAYGFHASNGILFNHESPIRGETFVTRKITRGAARIVNGLQRVIYLGNLDAKRDWGHARDFIVAQWLVMQQPSPDDYVIATGEQYSVREFCNRVFCELGIELEWRGRGIEETAVVAAVEGQSAEYVVCGDVVIRIDKEYFRPTEVDSLLGDSSKARMQLGWRPTVSFGDLVKEMVCEDLKRTKCEVYRRNNGCVVDRYFR